MHSQLMLTNVPKMQSNRRAVSPINCAGETRPPQDKQ